MVDGGEESADVALEHEGVAAGELGEAVEGRMRALAYPACVAVADEASLEDGLDLAAKGMVVYDRGLMSRRKCSK